MELMDQRWKEDSEGKDGNGRAEEGAYGARENDPPSVKDTWVRLAQSGSRQLVAARPRESLVGWRYTLALGWFGCHEVRGCP